MQRINARSLVVGDIFESGAKITRITRGPGTFHTTFWTDANFTATVSDTETFTIRDQRDN
jgi:hypothetical protein